MKDIREYENIHIFLWLLKDACWVMTWRMTGMALIIPTLLVALHITWKSRKNIHELFHNVAVSLWICANGTWMTGEFFFNDTTRPYATVFFAAGISVITVYYIFVYPRKWKERMAAEVIK